MKVLVIGSGGMLGHTTTLYLRNRGYEVIDVSKSRKIDENTLLLNVLNESSLINLLKQEFDVVINCAALLVKSSEENKADAIMLNTWFPHKLERMLEKTKTRIIHMSTDGVFSGLDGPYLERDIHDSPLFYGKTKSLGELNNNKDLTIRASVVGPDISKEGMGLFNWFVQQKDNVLGYDQTFFNAVTSLEFAKFVECVIENPISGVYHLGANETISKAEFLAFVKEILKLENINIKKIKNEKTDHTLLNSYSYNRYERKNYVQMLEELKNWISANPDLYKHYNLS